MPYVTDIYLFLFVYFYFNCSWNFKWIVFQIFYFTSLQILDEPQLNALI